MCSNIQATSCVEIEPHFFFFLQVMLVSTCIFFFFWFFCLCPIVTVFLQWHLQPLLGLLREMTSEHPHNDMCVWGGGWWCSFLVLFSCELHLTIIKLQRKIKQSCLCWFNMLSLNCFFSLDCMITCVSAALYVLLQKQSQIIFSTLREEEVSTVGTYQQTIWKGEAKIQERDRRITY